MIRDVDSTTWRTIEAALHAVDEARRTRRKDELVKPTLWPFMEAIRAAQAAYQATMRDDTAEATACLYKVLAEALNAMAKRGNLPRLPDVPAIGRGETILYWSVAALADRAVERTICEQCEAERADYICPCCGYDICLECGHLPGLECAPPPRTIEIVITCQQCGEVILDLSDKRCHYCRGPLCQDCDIHDECCPEPLDSVTNLQTPRCCQCSQAEPDGHCQFCGASVCKVCIADHHEDAHVIPARRELHTSAIVDRQARARVLRHRPGDRTSGQVTAADAQPPQADEVTPQ